MVSRGETVSASNERLVDQGNLSWLIRKAVNAIKTYLAILSDIWLARGFLIMIHCIIMHFY